MERRATSQRERGTVVGLIKDMFFGITVRNTIRRLQYVAQIIKTSAELESAIAVYEPDLVIVDLNSIDPDEPAWEILKQASASGVQILAFGPHRDVERMRAAKQAGVTRIVANSQFHREMATLIERYAGHTDENSEESGEAQ